MDSYQYVPFSQTESLSKTRVLTLYPGGPQDPLVGTLSILDLADPAPFEAVSYVWGWGHHWEYLNCGGKTIQLTSSLSVALERLRHPAHARVIWVDQLCINQQDMIERSQQVRHMNSIYQKASKVLVYLGVDKDGHAERAFALIRRLAEIGDEPTQLENFKKGVNEVNEASSECWASLGELFKQPWFDRKWILQEIGTATPAVLFWGEFSIDWELVFKAATLLRDHGFSLRRQYDILVWKPWYMYRLFDPSAYEPGTLSFAYELHRSRWQRANDPRDHIFSLLGHPAAQVDSDGTRVMDADYSKSADEIYLDITVKTLQKGDSLMMLNVVQHDSVEKAMERRKIPTWVPQWDSQSSLHNLLGDDKCSYCPSGEIRPAPKFLESNRVLLLDGMIIDTVKVTSKILGISDFTLGSATIAGLWKSQPECEDEVFSTTRTYYNGEPAIHAFLETLAAVKQRKQEKLVKVTASERLADGADFLVRAFGRSHVIGDDLKNMSQSGDCYKWMERASGGANGRKFARGEQGYHALCPPTTRMGDKLCLLLGGQTLFCLRPCEESYLFVGECYVHGVMYGEALEMLNRGELAQITLSIR